MISALTNLPRHCPRPLLHLPALQASRRFVQVLVLSLALFPAHLQQNIPRLTLRVRRLKGRRSALQVAKGWDAIPVQTAVLEQANAPGVSRLQGLVLVIP